MQHIFEINTSQLNQIFETMFAKLGERRVKVVIEDLPTPVPVDQREMFIKTEQLRLKLKRIKIDPNINLSDLADEMLNTRL